MRAKKPLIFLVLSIVTGLFIAHELFLVIPKKEMGHNLAALGTYRSMIEIYHSEKGEFPSTIEQLIPKYGNFPFAPGVPYATGWFSYETHPMGSHIQYVSELRPDDAGGWLYDNNPQSKDFGKIIINCTHLSYKGQNYSEM